MSFNPNSKQRAVDHACFLAIRAIQREVTSDPRLKLAAALEAIDLAAALEAIDRERTALEAIDCERTAPFTLQDCIAHLRASAAPRREQP